jgi:hypothetical protein
VDDLPVRDPGGHIDRLAGLVKRRSLFPRLVRPVLVVVLRVLGQDPPEVPFAVDQQLAGEHLAGRGVVFQTYPSLKALYAAYTAKVMALNSNQFKQNFSDCRAQGTYGEVGWNHLFQHTKAYSVGQMTMGMVKDDQGCGPGVLQLHPGPGIHGLDAERRPHDGLRSQPGAHERVGLVGRRPPQHRYRRRPHDHVTIGRGKHGCKCRSIAAVLPGPSSAASRITIDELR